MSDKLAAVVRKTLARDGSWVRVLQELNAPTHPEQLRVLVAAREVLLEEAHPALRFVYPRPVDTRRTVEAHGEKLVTLERLETLLRRQVTPQPVQQLLT